MLVSVKIEAIKHFCSSDEDDAASVASWLSVCSRPARGRRIDKEYLALDESAGGKSAVTNYSNSHDVIGKI